MANASRWPLSDQVEMQNGKRISVTGSLMGSLAGERSGAPIGSQGWPRAAEASAGLSPLQPLRLSSPLAIRC